MMRRGPRGIKGWPPQGNKGGPFRGHSVGGKASGGLSPVDPRSGTERSGLEGVKASDEFRFPTRPHMDTKDGNE